MDSLPAIKNNKIIAVHICIHLFLKLAFFGTLVKKKKLFVCSNLQIYLSARRTQGNTARNL